MFVDLIKVVEVKSGLSAKLEYVSGVAFSLKGAYSPKKAYVYNTSDDLDAMISNIFVYTIILVDYYLFVDLTNIVRVERSFL